MYLCPASASGSDRDSVSAAAPHAASVAIRLVLSFSRAVQQASYSLAVISFRLSARFYTLFNKLPCTGDREEFKKSIVLQYTWNRTDSLKEMTAKEYEACCTALEKLTGQDEWRQKLREELRRKRSLCLNLMQKLGIDTSDWARINDFCSNPRIAGKAFRQITVDELEELAVKLRSIQRKGGLKPKKEKQTINSVSVVSLIQIDPDAPAN